MKILILCSKPPYPARDGGCLATLNMIKGLKAHGCSLTILSIATPKHNIPENLPSDVSRLATWYYHFIDTNLDPFNGLLTLMNGKSYNISRFYSKGMSAELTEIIQAGKFDIVQLEGLYTSPYLKTIRKYFKGPVSLRSHNVEYKIWERLGKQAKGIKSWYLNLLTKRLKNWEQQIVRDIDLLVPLSATDELELSDLGFNGKSKVIPFMITVKEYQKVKDPSKDLFFLGSMEWLPNLEGLQWFIDKIWPGINEKFPDLKLHLAGKAFPNDWPETAGTVIHGEIPDAREFINQHGIMVVPLLSGSGIRIKIIEAMALGHTVISTKVGIEGIPANNNEEVFIANTKEEWITAVEAALKKDLSLAARKFAIEEFDSETLLPKLIAFYNSHL